MPNHCYQQVFLRGPREIIAELFNSLTYQEPQFLQTISPVPLEMFLDNTWYDWRIENWGTKWEVVDVEVEDASFRIDENVLPMSITGAQPCESEMFGKEATISFQCWTAWGPPIPVWKRLKDLGVFVDADYQDEGGMFEGTWLDGVGDSWNPEEGEDIEDE